ncbi:hypothetical protein G9A89_021350 [Geosiphon pyriformis]|nr:hypothetical protein G9A89_021350 [Geosiphon pyriformis]
MTTASAPAVPIEHGDPFIRHTKNRIASLSSKNKEILDDLNKLSQKQSQALSAINSQLETISPHLEGGENHIDNLVNGLKFKSRRNSFQRQNSSLLRVDLSANTKNLYDSPEENFEEISSNTRSAKNKTVHNKDSKSELNFNGRELDWKYLSAETNNSESENANENFSNLEEKEGSGDDDDDDDGDDAADDLDVLGRRKNSRHPTLTINMKTTVPPNRRLLTPEASDSDSDFDLSNSHIAFSPSLFGGKNSVRIRARTMSESGVGISGRRHGSSNIIFSSVDEVIEEEAGLLSDAADLPQMNGGFNKNDGRLLGKTSTLLNDRNHSSTKEFLDSYTTGRNNSKVNKITHRGSDESSYNGGEIVDDNISIRSDNSLLEELGALKTRIKKLENERSDMDDAASINQRLARRRQPQNANTIESSSLISPGGSSAGGSSSTTSLHHSFALTVQHQKHLQNAFEFFEKSFTMTKVPVDDGSPPPSHSMAMVVSAAQQLNFKLRGLLSQTESDRQFPEWTIKELLKTSDEQIRSLTECLLALPTLVPSQTSLSSSSSSSSSRRMAGEREYQQNSRHLQSSHDTTRLRIPTNVSRSARSVSPVSTSSRTDGHLSLKESNLTIEPSMQRISQNLPNDQSSSNHSYYGAARNSRQSNITRNSMSQQPRLASEHVSDLLSTNSRIHQNQGRPRRSSGGSHESQGSFSGTLPSSSPSPPPHSLPSPNNANHQEQPYSNINPLLDRDRRFTHRYSISSTTGYTNVSSPITAQSRIASRVPSSLVRKEEPSSSSFQHGYHAQLNLEMPSSNETPVTRAQTRTQDYTRRYQYEGAHPEYERRYERRTVGNEGLENGHGNSYFSKDSVLERQYVNRNHNFGSSKYDTGDDGQELRRSLSNSSTASFQKRTLTPPETEVENNGDIRNETNNVNDRDMGHGDRGSEGGETPGHPNGTDSVENQCYL